MIQRLYIEEGAKEYPLTAAILRRYPNAEQISITNHWQIPELNRDPAQADQWLANKQQALVLGVKKTKTIRPNGRSTDFIAPGLANGCEGACSYCFVARRKGFANPITLFVNTDEFFRAVFRHAEKQGPKTTPNQCDPQYWTYDIGENSDVSVDASYSPAFFDYIGLFKALPNAKGSFATKFVNRELLNHDPQGKMRIRFSVMPQAFSKVLDVRTTPVAQRIAAINDFVEAGYEVHLNFSPVIVNHGWRQAYQELLQQVRSQVSDKARAQLKAEVIFLTHNQGLHEVNLKWHPKGEDLIWMPNIQEAKTSENGDRNLRYQRRWKSEWVSWLNQEISRTLAIPIRYSF